MRAKLKISRGGTTVRRCALHPGELLEVGRGREADIRLKGLAISRRHAAFELTGDGVHVKDRGSRNGTRIDDVQMEPNSEALLTGQEVVLIGPYTVEVSLSAADSGVTKETRASVQALVAGDGIEIRHLVGRGATSTVWSGYQEALRRLIAVKVLDRGGLDDESRERFLREGQVVGRISHKNVVQLHDLRVKDGSPFLILELVRGVSVMERLREGVVSIFEALEVGQNIASALNALADEGVVHRDVKPSNVLLSPDGVAKLSDFGIAKDLNAPSDLTQAGVGLGTFSFMAPEQFQEARAVDHTADMYGLGATLYHMIAGRPPFIYTSGVNPVALVKEILESSPPRLRELRPDCPLEIADFVHRLISKEPRERPQPAEFVEAMLRKLRKQHCATETQRMLWESSSDTSTGD